MHGLLKLVDMANTPTITAFALTFTVLMLHAELPEAACCRHTEGDQADPFRYPFAMVHSSIWGKAATYPCTSLLINVFADQNLVCYPSSSFFACKGCSVYLVSTADSQNLVANVITGHNTVN